MVNIPYTFVPEQKYARAHGNSLRISRKASVIVCRAIKKKPLSRAKRLLNDMISEKRSLDGKYYTKAAKEILMLLNSCEKNAEFMGLENEKLMVHASASKGANMRRRRRKAKFGSGMKSTNIEIYLIERGKESKTKVSKKKIDAQKAATVNKVAETIKEEIEKKQKEIAQKKKEEKVEQK